MALPEMLRMITSPTAPLALHWHLLVIHGALSTTLARLLSPQVAASACASLLISPLQHSRALDDNSGSVAAALFLQLPGGTELQPASA
jgi:hypothetical protein